MQAEIICAIIAVVGVFASAAFAWITARSTANKEIERLEKLWEREDVVTSDDDFADMVAKVAEYVAAVSAGYASNPVDATAKVAAVRSKETGVLAVKLDALYTAIRSKDIRQIDTCLTDVIAEKRKRKSEQNRPGGDDPQS